MFQSIYPDLALPRYCDLIRQAERYRRAAELVRSTRPRRRTPGAWAAGSHILRRLVALVRDGRSAQPSIYG